MHEEKKQSENFQDKSEFIRSPAPGSEGKTVSGELVMHGRAGSELNGVSEDSQAIVQVGGAASINLLHGCSPYEADSMLYGFGDEVVYDWENGKLNGRTYAPDRGYYQWRYNDASNSLEFINVSVARSNELKLKAGFSLLSVTTVMFIAMSALIAVDMDALDGGPLLLLLLFALSLLFGIFNGLHMEKKLDEAYHLRQRLYCKHYDGENDYSYQPFTSFESAGKDEYRLNGRVLKNVAKLLNHLLDHRSPNAYNFYVTIIKHFYENGRGGEFYRILPGASMRSLDSLSITTDEEYFTYFPIDGGIIKEVFGGKVLTNVQFGDYFSHIVAHPDDFMAQASRLLLETPSRSKSQDPGAIVGSWPEPRTSTNIEELILLDERLALLQRIEKMPLKDEVRGDLNEVLSLLGKCALTISEASDYSTPDAVRRDGEKFSKIVDACLPFLEVASRGVDEERYNTLSSLEEKIRSIVHGGDNFGKDGNNLEGKSDYNGVVRDSKALTREGEDDE